MSSTIHTTDTTDNICSTIILKRNNMEISLIWDEDNKVYIVSEIIHPSDGIGLARANACKSINKKEAINFILEFL